MPDYEGATAEPLRWGNDRFTLQLDLAHDHAARIAGMEVDGRAFESEGGVPLVDITTANFGRLEPGGRFVHTEIGHAMRYKDHRVSVDDSGNADLSITLACEAVEAVICLRAPIGIAGLQIATSVSASVGASPLVLRSISTIAFSLTRATDWILHTGRSDWLAEGRWHAEPLGQYRFPNVGEALTGHDPRSDIRVIGSGAWSTSGPLPTGMLTSSAAAFAYAWQIEHNGEWRYDIGRDADCHWLGLSGPTDLDHGWTHTIRAGERFESVPVALAFGIDLDSTAGEMTLLRRAARRSHPDNEQLPVIFNDYMNTINGDPSTKRLEPLIDAAADLGAEVFCIDAGWQGDDGWWDTVGEWLPSKKRFPGGLPLLLDRIRRHGLTPGLWLEPEVVGVRSSVAAALPGDAFLHRGGQRIVETGRFHLDLRHPAAIHHLNAVVDRLVDEYGVGYLKLDYNIDPGGGSDLNGSNPADGLLQSNRAHQRWIDDILDRHSSLIIENCAAGAMRADFALLSRTQLQSTSDQQDWLRLPPIVASAPMTMLPEQAANWAYPQPEMTLEQVAFTALNLLVGRPYLSGFLDSITGESRELVRQAVQLAKTTRHLVRAAKPFWPLGLPGWDAPYVAMGLSTETELILAVWHRDGSDQPLRLPVRATVEVTQIFPSSLQRWEQRLDLKNQVLEVRNTTGVPSARLFGLQQRDPLQR